MKAVNKTRVLIVKDDPSTLRLYSSRLSQAGFDVARSSKPSEALRRAENWHFDVLVADFKLPEIDGLELVRRLRQGLGDLQSVLILDTTDNQLSLKAAKMGVFQSLVKPIEPKLLQDTIDLAIRSRREVRNSAALRTRRSEASERISFGASEAKNKFAHVLEKATQGEVVFITKHDSPKAVMISVESFEALSRAPEVRIDRLATEFDALLARMQQPGRRKAMDTAFHAAPAALGKAAVAAARRRD